MKPANQNKDFKPGSALKLFESDQTHVRNIFMNINRVNRNFYPCLSSNYRITNILEKRIDTVDTFLRNFQNLKNI